MNSNSSKSISDQLLKYNVSSALNSAAQTLPYFVTASNTFSATSASAQITNIIDSSYHFFVTGLTLYQTASDKDTFVTAIQVNSTSNYLQNNLPFVMVTQFTGAIWPLSLFVPANNNLVTTFQNGSTTAANTVYATFQGIKIPVGVDISKFLN